VRGTTASEPSGKRVSSGIRGEKRPRLSLARMGAAPSPTISPKVSASTTLSLSPKVPPGVMRSRSRHTSLSSVMAIQTRGTLNLSRISVRSFSKRSRKLWIVRMLVSISKNLRATSSLRQMTCRISFTSFMEDLDPPRAGFLCGHAYSIAPPMTMKKFARPQKSPLPDGQGALRHGAGDYFLSASSIFGTTS